MNKFKVHFSVFSGFFLFVCYCLNVSSLSGSLKAFKASTSSLLVPHLLDLLDFPPLTLNRLDPQILLEPGSWLILLYNPQSVPAILGVDQ